MTLTTSRIPSGAEGFQTRLLHELEPVVEQNLERHLSVAKPWMPHDYIPWSQGRDFAFLGGEDWQPEDSPLDPVAQTAMIVNLLTEDNLPSYHREIATQFGRDGVWGQWVGQWTAEEGRHGIALRDYLVVTRGVDPVRLEQLRMEHMVAGYDSGDKTPLQAVAYVSFQELATRVSHRNTGKATGCPLAEQLLQRVALDENLHMGLLPQPGGSSVRHRAERNDGCSPRRGHRIPDAGREHARLHAQLGGDRQGGHL
jgi:acyl-[acyl-carrier-protein] desaturase